MAEAIGGTPAVPTISIDIQQSPLTKPLRIGQALRAQVLESLGGGRALIAIGGMQMHAAADIAVAPGDVLHLTVRSTDPVVLQLQGMDYVPEDPLSALASAARLLGLAPDSVTRAILSHMIKRDQKLSRSAANELRRTIASLRSQGIDEETDDELLDLIDALRARDLPATPAHLNLAKRSAGASGDLGAFCAELLAALTSSAAQDLPEELKAPILLYFKNNTSLPASLRHRIGMLGVDYEHSLLAWGLGSADAPASGSLKAALMKLIAYIEGGKENHAHARIRAAAENVIARIEPQQFRALAPALPGEAVWEIPFEAEGSLRTLTLSVTQEGGRGRMGDDVPRECSFRMSIELSELGTITAAGRLAAGCLSASLMVDDDAHARALEEGANQLSRSLRAAGCAPVSLSVRTGPGACAPAVRKAVNASA